MSLPRFYLPGPIQPGNLQLPTATAHYMTRVLRLNVGSQVQLFDGSGAEWLASITTVGKKDCCVEVLETLPAMPASRLQVHLGQALSKGERMDWAIQKATELGANQITPLITARCEVRLNDERAEKRREHWQQIAISACEQSGRSDVPVINPVCSLQQWLDGLNAELKLLLHPEAAPFSSHATPSSLALLIGPEGGLNQQDLELASASGFAAASLGPRILRTETAPVAALAIAQLLWGDFGYNAAPK